MVEANPSPPPFAVVETPSDVDAAPSPAGSEVPKQQQQRRGAPRIIRRRKKAPPSSSSSTNDNDAVNDLPAHIRNNAQLHHVISTTLPKDYEFEIPKTLWRIEKSCAKSVALQLPEGLTMYASAIGDILVKFAYRFQPPQPEDGEGKTKDSRPKEIESLSVLGDVTYGACCIDDLTARALGCDLLVHYGHSCLVPLTCTVVPCLYVFVEIRVDVQHLVDCIRLTFEEEERKRGHIGGEGDVMSDSPARIVEALVMGTVQFRSAVVESAQRLNNNTDLGSNSSLQDRILFQAVVPQAKPLSPGEVLGCTAPSGLAQMDFQEAMAKTRRRQARKGQAADASSNAEAAADDDDNVPRERVMIFLADGRFHLEAAMIANPSLRALRYDPYSKTLTEEQYEMAKMRKLRRDAILATRKVLGVLPPAQRIDVIGGMSDSAADQSGNDIAGSLLQQWPSSRLSPSSRFPSSSSSLAPSKTMGIILGTLGRQGNPAILSRVRSLLHSRGIRSVIVLLSEIFPKKLEMMSNLSPGAARGGVCAWVQIACPRLSVDWGHHFRVPVLSPFELFVALGEVSDPSLLQKLAVEEKHDVQDDGIDDGYPMDFYSKDGGPWANYYQTNKERKVVSYGS